MTDHAQTAESVLKYLDNPRTDLAKENDADPTSVATFALVHATLAINETLARIADALERAHPVSDLPRAHPVARCEDIDLDNVAAGPCRLHLSHPGDHVPSHTGDTQNESYGGK